MKLLILPALISLVFINTAFAAETAKADSAHKRKPSQNSSLEINIKKIKTWKQTQAELMKIKTQFTDAKLTADEKVALLPVSNQLLSIAQDFKLKNSEKEQQIQFLVEFLAASHDADFANSNQDTLYFDYKDHKAEYLKAINSLSSAELKKELIETFTDFEKSEQNNNSPDSDNGSEAEG